MQVPSTTTTIKHSKLIAKQKHPGAVKKDTAKQSRINSGTNHYKSLLKTRTDISCSQVQYIPTKNTLAVKNCDQDLKKAMMKKM